MKSREEVVMRFGAKRVLQMLDDLEAGGFATLTECGQELRATAEKLEKEPFGAQLGAEGQKIAARLREWRREVARRWNVSAYLVMTNRILFAVAAARPATKDVLRTCGVSERVATEEGDAILMCMGESVQHPA